MYTQACLHTHTLAHIFFHNQPANQPAPRGFRSSPRPCIRPRFLQRREHAGAQRVRGGAAEPARFRLARAQYEKQPRNGPAGLLQRRAHAIGARGQAGGLVGARADQSHRSTQHNPTTARPYPAAPRILGGSELST